MTRRNRKSVVVGLCCSRSTRVCVKEHRGEVPRESPTQAALAAGWLKAGNEFIPPSANPHEVHQENHRKAIWLPIDKCPEISETWPDAGTWSFEFTLSKIWPTRDS